MRIYRPQFWAALLLYGYLELKARNMWEGATFNVKVKNFQVRNYLALGLPHLV